MLCTADEKVLLNTPAYGYFLHAAEYAGVDVLTSPLHKKADGTFEVDYEDFERKCADPACKLVFWCNPHNPTGRMWTEEAAQSRCDHRKVQPLGSVRRDPL